MTEYKHPAHDLLEGKERGVKYMIDSLSARFAKIDIKDLIKDELIKSLLVDFARSEQGDKLITEQVDEGHNTVYYARAFILGRDEMLKLVEDAFQRGMDFQYQELHRKFADTLMKAEESQNDKSTPSDEE